jgi:hypothetical protein
MENEELENIDSQTDESEELDSTTETVDQEDESTEEDKPEYTEREKQLYARAKKAEAALKENKPAEKKKEAQTGNLSTLDIIALSKADIADEDIDEVLEYAKYKGISVKEALGASILKATLSEKNEERKSAQAVNTGATRRGSSQVSDDRLMADARKGVMPEKEEDMARLAILRIKNR